MQKHQYDGKRETHRLTRVLGGTWTALVGLALGIMLPFAAHAGDAGRATDGLTQVAQAAGNAQTSAGPGPEQGVDEATIEEVVVSGSRIAQKGLFAFTSVTSLDQTDYKLSGTVNAEGLLNTLPQFVPAGTRSANIPGPGVATLDLRGLGPNRTLVLVNGKRWIFFDSQQITDVNTIPTALIERTEVVTGGSSAVYGSDAVAGVVNFILRDHFEGFQLQTQQNLDSRGNGLTSDFNVTMGTDFANGRGNVVMAINYFKREPIFNSQRDFAKLALVDRVDANGVPFTVLGGSADVLNGRFSGIPRGSALDVRGREGLRDALVAAGLQGLGSKGFVPDDSGMNAAPFQDPQGRFNYAPFNFVQVPLERWSFTQIGHYDITSKITAYAEATYSHNSIVRQQSPTPVRGNFLFNVDNPFLGPELQGVLRQLDLSEGRIVGRVVDPTTGDVLDPGMIDPNNADGTPFVTTVRNGTTTRTTTPGDGLAVLAVGRRLGEISARPIEDTRNAYRILLGFRGDLGDVNDNYLRNLSYDVSYTFARTENTQRKKGLVSLSAFSAGVLAGSGGANGAPLVNPFGPNISSAGADFIARDITNLENSELQVISATLTGELFDMPNVSGSSPGAAAFSIGTEWRSTSGRFIPDEFLSSGDIAGATAGKPTSGRVRVWELFGEVRVPLLADLPLVDSLTVNGALRYSNYDLSGVGNTYTYQGGTDWRVTKDVGFRGQFQRSIRAPNINELFAGQFQVFRSATDPCAQSGAATDPIVRALCVQTGVPAALVGDSSVQPNFQIEGLAGGNPNLRAEKSDTYTFGGVFTPHWLPDLIVTINYFDIKVSGAVGVAGGGVNSALDLCFNVIQDINSDICQLISRNPLTGVIQSPFFVNALSANTGKLKTEGIDTHIGYRWDAGFGLLSDVSSFDFKFDGTWTNKFTITPLQARPGEKNFCIGTFGNTCGEPKPEFKTVMRLTWTTGPLSLSARHRFIDAVKDDRVFVPPRNGRAGRNPATTFKPRFKSQQYIDLSFSYDLLENVVVYGGVNNITDNKPPIKGDNVQQANTFPNVYDAIGTEFYLSAAVKF